MTARRKGMAFLLSVILACVPLTMAAASEGNMGPLSVKNGMLQPVFTCTDAVSSDYTNEGSDLLRFCVWVETDYDTDGDGKDDLVKVLAQVPRAAAEGKYKAAVIYDPTPYNAGTMDKNFEDPSRLYTEEPFDYAELYRHGEKRTPTGIRTTLEQAEKAFASDWMYEPLDALDAPVWGGISSYDYYLARGFAGLPQAPGQD